MTEANKRVGKLIRKKQAFTSLFLDDQNNLTPDAEVVMRDLAGFCYMGKTTAKFSPKSGMIDTSAMLIAEGRREAYLRILHYLNIDDATFTRLLTQQYTENEQ